MIIGSQEKTDEKVGGGVSEGTCSLPDILSDIIFNSASYKIVKYEGHSKKKRRQ